MMSPQDLENFTSRLQDRIMAVETNVKGFTNTLNILTETLKGINGNTAELKGLESKLAYINKQLSDLKVESKNVETQFDKRLKSLEAKPTEIKKRWYQK